MSTTTPYWSALLHHFERKGYISNGLTVPFLIGARSRIEPGKALLNISELVNSINEVGGTILMCGNISEFVIGTLDTETSKYKSTYTNCIDNIIITDNSLHNVNNLNTLISCFEDRYQEILNNSQYSKNYGEWTDFTDTEKRQIDEINLR